MHVDLMEVHLETFKCHCVGVDINVQLTERIVATVYCAGDTIIEFVTSSPLYMIKTLVAPVSGTSNQFYITLTWTPVADQYGPQVSMEHARL